MLGLGDIVVPGIFIALALRYDHFRYEKAQPPAGTFTKPYFIASLVAYVAGLATTMAVMHLFHSAQPALLYLRYASFLSIHLLQYMRTERMPHDMEIALLVSCLLFSPPGAAGSLSKPGDGMMELVLRPRMGTQWTNQLAMPRAEHRPPIPRMPSSHENILRTPTVITYELICCHQLPSVLQPSGRLFIFSTSNRSAIYTVRYYCESSTLQRGFGRLRSRMEGI